MSKDALSCPYCGGSGHKDDIPHDKQARIASLESQLAAATRECEQSMQTIAMLREALEEALSGNRYAQLEAAARHRAEIAEAEVKRLRINNRHFDILAEAMAEVKATSDGMSDQPIADIVAGCLAEIAALPRAALQGGNDAR